MDDTGDSYRRIETSTGVYQCGCLWERTQSGDILRECIFHKQVTVASVVEFDREQAALLNTEGEGDVGI